MTEPRQGKLYILIGVNGTGKSTIQKQLLRANKRNLVLPSNALDKAWSDQKELLITRDRILNPDNPKPKHNDWIWDYKAKGLNSFNGTRKIFLDSDAKAFEDVVCNPYKGFRNGGLFIDDFKTYVKGKGNLKASFKKLFIDRRHRMLDIFLASHTFEDINSEIYGYGATLLIFKTTKPPNQNVLDKINNQQEFLETIERVSHIAKTKNPYYCEKLQIN